MDCDPNENTLYPIREVAELTGVKPVTLRAWQRRYNLIQPARTEKGHRLFTQDNIETIKEIQRWLAKGVSIGKVKALLGTDADETDNDALNKLEQTDALLSALAAFNRSKADKVISEVLKEYPFDLVSQQFVYPVLEALALVKTSSRSLQQGLFRTLMQSRLSSIVESENKAARRGKCLILSLEEASMVSSWLEAVAQSEQGYHVSLIDGIEDLSGLVSHDVLANYTKVVVFSNHALVEKQLNIVQHFKQEMSESFEVSSVIQTLHFSH